MNDALWMNDDVDRVERQVEQHMRLDHLERLVRESRAVDRILPAHAPGWMPESVLNGRGRETLRAPPAKRSSRRSENHTPHLRAGTTRNALKNCRVLAVDGNQLAASVFSRFFHQ